MTAMLKRRSRIRERNERQILEAAEKVFAERGFGAATTAEIAKASELPKANLHYYFPTKEDLYLKVLENILESWLTAAEDFDEFKDPADALRNYIHTKMELSRTRPSASKIFAKEIISGAPFLNTHLQENINPWINNKTAIIEKWAADKKIRRVNARHLFFQIWAMTQSYADFSTQMEIVLEKKKLTKSDFETGKNMITEMIFGLCGLK